MHPIKSEPPQESSCSLNTPSDSKLTTCSLAVATTDHDLDTLKNPSKESSFGILRGNGSPSHPKPTLSNGRGNFF
ncbi:Glyceraldehyde-3-phosphate dehydrogenase [Psidium guajava]|nr:Glyceraldehyde-3-phosphate dehydrogenase [Psidium guajava]